MQCSTLNARVHAFKAEPQNPLLCKHTYSKVHNISMPQYNKQARNGSGYNHTQSYGRYLCTQ